VHNQLLYFLGLINNILKSFSVSHAGNEDVVCKYNIFVSTKQICLVYILKKSLVSNYG
jgi:hypothetical protein